MESNDRSIGEPAPETTPRPIASLSMLGGIVEYHPLSDDELATILLRCTPKQRLVLHYASKGLERSDSAEQAHVTPETIDSWRKQEPGYRDAYYTCLALGKHITVAGLRKVAESDALEHYEAIHALATQPTNTERGKTTQLNAATKALELAGAFKDEALAPGESLEITAIRVRRSREAAKSLQQAQEPVDATFTEQP